MTYLGMRHPSDGWMSFGMLDVLSKSASGVPGLDDILSGGFTKGSLFLIEGLRKQPQHSKGTGPNNYMLTRDTSQFIRVEINHMMWQSHLMLRRCGPVAGHS